MTDIKSMFPAELETFVKELGEPKFRAKQLYEWIHRRHAASFEEMTNLPKQGKAVRKCFSLRAAAGDRAGLPA